MVSDFINTLKLTPSGGNLQPWIINASSFENHYTLTFEIDQAAGSNSTDAFSFGKLISLGMLQYSCHYLASEFDLNIISSNIEKRSIDHFPKVIIELAKEHTKSVSSSQKLEIFKKRFTNRARYLQKSIKQEILTTLRSEFNYLDILETSEEKKMAIDLQKKLSLIRFQNKNLFKEMLAEITLEEDRVGIPISSLGLNFLMRKTIKLSKLFPVILPLESLYAYPIRQSTTLPLQNSAAIGILTQPHGDLENWIKLGSDFMKLWLELTENNIHLQPIGSTLIICNYFYDSKAFSFNLRHQKILHDNEFFKSSRGLVDLKLPNIFFRIGYSDTPFRKIPRQIINSQIFF